MFGKILGGIIGLGVGLLAGSWTAAWILAIAGVFVGHRWDALHQVPLDGAELPSPRPSVARTPELADEPVPAPSRAEIEAESRAAFARHVCALFAEVARADGEVVRDEVRVVRLFFEEELRYGPLELDLVRRSLKAALAEPGDLRRAADECRAELSASERLLLLNALYELALADGELRRPERDAIRRVCEALRIPQSDVRSIAAMHLGDGAPHFAVLGVEPDVSDDELKSAFRRLAATHHPDKVAHLGPGAAELASRRFREIKDAYEALRRIRGF